MVFVFPSVFPHTCQPIKGSQAEANKGTMDVGDIYILEGCPIIAPMEHWKVVLLPGGPCTSNGLSPPWDLWVILPTSAGLLQVLQSW